MLLSGLLRSGMRYGSTAAAPPSASLPAGLSGGRIRSLIHASLVVILARQVAGSHIYDRLFSAAHSHLFGWLAKSRQIL